MSTEWPFTVLYRDWSDRMLPWVLTEKTSSGFRSWRIRRELPTLDAAIDFVAEEYGCPARHWDLRDPERGIARAVGE